MVLLHMKTTSKEVPICDIIATGHIPFFKDLSENCAEFKGQSNIDRFRLIYNGKVLNEEELKKITDNDAIRVILLPESKLTKPVDDAYKTSVDTELTKLSAPFRNPEDRRIHGFSNEFSEPNHVLNALKAHPQLVFNSQFVSVLKDYFMFRAYFFRNTYKNDVTRGLFKYNNPEFVKIFKEFTYGLGSKHGYALGEPQRAFQGQRPFQGQIPAAGGAAPITPALLQNALQAALAGVAAPPPVRAPAQAPAPAPVRAQPPPQPAEEPMQQGYEQQAAILREYGFENDELIQLALEQSNGDIQAAMEFLIELQN